MSSTRLVIVIPGEDIEKPYLIDTAREESCRVSNVGRYVRDDVDAGHHSRAGATAARLVKDALLEEINSQHHPSKHICD